MLPFEKVLARPALTLPPDFHDLFGTYLALPGSCFVSVHIFMLF